MNQSLRTGSRLYQQFVKLKMGQIEPLASDVKHTNSQKIKTLNLILIQVLVTILVIDFFCQSKV